MPLAIINEDGDVLIDLLLIDATPSRSVKVTDRPVERGLATSDHAQPLPEDVRFTVGLSDTPVDGPGAPGLAAELYAQLDALALVPQRVELITTVRTYNGYVLTSVSAPYRAETGRALVCDLSFREVRVLTTQTTGVPASILAAVVRSGGKGKDNTRQPPRGETKGEASARRKSVLKGLKDALVGR